MDLLNFLEQNERPAEFETTDAYKEVLQKSTALSEKAIAAANAYSEILAINPDLADLLNQYRRLVQAELQAVIAYDEAMAKYTNQ